MLKLFRQAMRCSRQLIISSVSIILTLVFALHTLACDIALKKQATVKGDQVYLEDVTSKCPDALKDLFIADAPYVNGSITVTADLVRSILKSTHQSRYSVCGNVCIVKRQAYYITRKSIERITGISHIKILRHMPIVLPYAKYTLKLKRISRNRDFVWIEIDLLKNGRYLRTLGISARIDRSYYYPVAARDISRGQTIEESDITYVRLKRAPVANALKDTHSIVGRVAVVDIAKGSAFTPSNVRVMPQVKRGDMVSVIVVDGNIRITTVAKALKSGFLNSVIPIMYPRSKRVVMATVIGKKTVEVQ